MRIDSSPEKVYLRHFPVAQWTLGLLVLGLCFAGVIWLILGPHPFDTWIEVAYNIVMANLAIYENRRNSGIRAPAMEVAIDNVQRFIQVRRTYAYRRRVDRYYFHQVDRFHSYRGRRFGIERYLLAMKLRSRRTNRLGIPIGKEKNEVTKLIKDLNKRLRLQ